MVNTKKAKKNVAKEEVDSDAELTTTAVASSQKQSLASDEEDIIAEVKGKKKEKKPKAAKKQTSKQQDSGSDLDGADSDVEEITKKVKSLKVKKKPVKKAGFDLLMADMSDDDQPEPQAAPEPESDEEVEDVKPAKKADKKGKKAKGRKKDDEDLDKVLAEFTAELEVEYSGGKKADVVEAQDAKKGKKKVSEAVAADNDDGEEDEDGGGGTVKTAAQKKKEKKERQKREAAELKIKQINKETVEEADVAESEVAPVAKKEKVKKTKEVAVEAEVSTPVEEVEAITEAADEAGDKKKKKKTKAEREEEKEREKEAAAAAKKKKGGMSAAMVAAMQERLAKVKEEEEKAKREEEERIRREEELEDLRLEQVRLEAEKKEKKKLKEQERKARLKAEGKLLTAKQKQDKARAQAMLDSLRAQGIELPEVGEDKPKTVRLGTRIRPNKKNQQQQNQSESQSDLAATEEEAKSEVVAEPAVVEEKIKDSWDASSSEDESEEVKEVKKPSVKQTAKAGAKKGSVESDESDEDDEDDDDEDDSDEDDSDDDSDEDSEDDSDDEKKTDAERKREKVWERITKRRHAAEQKRTTDNLRAAVVCVLGHVDTGKTKILDKLRRTNVQDSEAGGITQQIGATNVPIEAIKEQTRIVKGYSDFTFRLPGLLIIDTPGHESFSNLRSRGSSLCDIAILVVDIMHGLEPQTIESINLLKAKKTPFIVALNKIDRLYNWDTAIRKDVRDILKNQAANTQLEFQQRTKEVVVQFAEQGLNAALFYENPDPRSYVNLVPTSAITGEGMGNLLFLIVESCQNLLAKRLMYSEELLATVLEVKAIPGLGTTIDAILINGKLREGDTMVIAGTDGPIVTQIRSLLMPQPMKELRVKNAYVEYKEIPAAQGVKIAAKELEKAIAGLNVYVANKPDEVDWCREEVAKELKSALSHIKLSGEGVYVQASTLGSLEALLEFLRTSKIPYANIRIGPVVKRDVMKASTMLVHDSQYATILAFDVKIERDAQDLADSLGVKIFQADIIYHLFDQFTNFRDELKRKKREEFKNVAVFPCKLKILPQFIFNSRDPIVMGVMIEAGIVKEGTPICVPSKEFLDIGIVTSIECNHKQVESARKGQEVCIKIEPIPGESPKMFGRHFEETDILTSKISRQSIDACKDYFRDDLLKADWALMVELKKQFQIL